MKMKTCTIWIFYGWFSRLIERTLVEYEHKVLQDLENSYDGGDDCDHLHMNVPNTGRWLWDQQ